MNASIRLFDLTLDNLTLDEATAAVLARVRRREPALVFTPNVDHIVRLARDADFRAAYAAADIVLADGMPLIWASRLLGTPLKARVAGSDLFPALCAAATAERRRIFLFGGRPGAAAGAAAVLRARYSDVNVVGMYAPPMGFERDAAENEIAIETIRQAQPELLFVGLGSPKQELWLHRHRDRLPPCAALGIGVSFELLAGMVSRAPRSVQRAGFEWAWRIAQEPGRLWRRYLVEDMQFFPLLLRELRARRRRARMAQRSDS